MMTSVEPAVVGVAQSVEFADVDHAVNLATGERRSSVTVVTAWMRILISRLAPPLGPMMAARRLVRRGLVSMRGMTMPGLGRKLLLHQHPAIAVPHDLPIAHLVALADRRA